MKHAGIYRLLHILKKRILYFFLLCYGKKVIKSCFNFKRTILTNTNDYRKFRISPKEIPFREIDLNLLDSFSSRVNNNKVKEVNVNILQFQLILQLPALCRITSQAG